MAATAPTRRERASPPAVHPEIEQVFTPAKTHRRRTPHPYDHAAHTTMVTGQHQATGPTHEHRDTTTRAAVPASNTSMPPHPPLTATPTKETSGKAPPFAPLSYPQRRDPIGRPKLASIGLSFCGAPDELDPVAVRETSSILLLGAIRARSCYRARHESDPATGSETSLVLLPGARRARDHNWEMANPSMKIVPERRGGGIKGRQGAHRPADAEEVLPPP